MAPASYTPEVKQLLRAAGCHLHRAGKGDHETWYSSLSNRYFTVDSKILSRHTANETLKQAGLKKAF